MNPIISIVMPTYQRQDFLALIVEELICQLPADGSVDVVVVDNDANQSARSVMPNHPAFHYVCEPRSGVAHARNTGVAATSGRYILFLDDDELPAPGWLDAFIACAEAGYSACFGPIEAQFTAPPPAELERLLRDMFGRAIVAPNGADITNRRSYLGTGNSMFRQEVLCSPDSAPFDTAFNGGGEDVWMLRHLAEDKGISFRWTTNALVFEQVPAHRCSLEFIKERKYLGGMLRCVVESGTPGWGKWWRVVQWMTIGLVQVVVFGVLGVVQTLLRLKMAPSSVARCAAGLGKIMWWLHPRIRGMK